MVRWRVERHASRFVTPFIPRDRRFRARRAPMPFPLDPYAPARAVFHRLFQFILTLRRGALFLGVGATPTERGTV